MDNKQIIPTTLGIPPYGFETERERKWYEIGLIDGNILYEDKTYISAEWLAKNGFVLHEVDVPDHEFVNLCRDKDYYLYCDDCVEISAELRNEEAGIWSIEITFLDHGDTEELNICTAGQFRMFLAICGLDNLAREFKLR